MSSNGTRTQLRARGNTPERKGLDGGSSEPGVELLTLLACIVAGAICTAVDEAIAALGEPRMRAARDGNDANARIAARYLDAPGVVNQRLLSGRIVSLMATAVVAYHLAARLQGGWFVSALVLASAALAYTTMVSVSVTFVTRRAGRLALPLLRYSEPLMWLFAPFWLPLNFLSRLVDKVLPARPDDNPELVTELDVGHLIKQGAEHGSIPAQNAELLRSVIEFGDTVVREVMVPRTSMVAIEIDTPLDEVMQLIIAEGHSRYPVYRERIDQVEGTLYAKDLFRLIREGGRTAGKLEDLIRRPVFFTANSQKISVLLRQMQARRVHVAIVVDEFGGTSGMVTLEDIIEEIVGEIRDEHDTDETPVRQIGPDRYLANADVSLYDLAEITGLALPEQARSYESL
ncbi:MAG TPA: hemolysin family protein, partial [Polyangiales bacterium]|nr:hemolysin family protein [Polyangiales bacterium]